MLPLWNYYRIVWIRYIEIYVSYCLFSDKLLIIEGAQGDCGGNVVHTELFRITTVDDDGNVESQYIDTTALNDENISKE